MKPGGYTPRGPRSLETRRGDNSILVDGTMGFSDPMDSDEVSGGHLYSDSLTNEYNDRRSQNSQNAYADRWKGGWS